MQSIAQFIERPEQELMNGLPAARVIRSISLQFAHDLDCRLTAIALPSAQKNHASRTLAFLHTSRYRAVTFDAAAAFQNLAATGLQADVSHRGQDALRLPQVAPPQPADGEHGQVPGARGQHLL